MSMHLCYMIALYRSGSIDRANTITLALKFPYPCNQLFRAILKLPYNFLRCTHRSNTTASCLNLHVSAEICSIFLQNTSLRILPVHTGGNAASDQECTRMGKPCTKQPIGSGTEETECIRFPLSSNICPRDPLMQRTRRVF